MTVPEVLLATLLEGGKARYLEMMVLPGGVALAGAEALVHRPSM
jgi:hypothetical protein